MENLLFKIPNKVVEKTKNIWLRMTNNQVLSQRIISLEGLLGLGDKFVIA